jgi:peptide/nickel transport system permease protein
MLRYALQRLLLMIPLLLGISIISFAVIRFAPGDPAEIQAEMSMKVTAESRENLRRIYGLDKPMHEQYIDWLVRCANLDFGRSFSDGRPVLSKIKERVPITLGINVLSLIVIFALAIPIGVYSAVRQYSAFDKVSTILVFIGFSTPTFWLALLLMILFGVNLGWLPISGIQSVDTSEMNAFERVMDIARHLILPVSVSAFAGLAGLSRYSRTSMLEVIRQDYIRTALAKGLTEWEVIMRHAFRNALLPIITILGMMLPALIGGSVIFETIFAIPGMGKMMIDAVYARDYPVVMGVLVIGAVLTLIGNLVADMSYSFVDPRIRHKGQD